MFCRVKERESTPHHDVVPRREGCCCQLAIVSGASCSCNAVDVHFCWRAVLLPPAFWLELTMELGKCLGAVQVIQLMDGLQCRPAICHTRLDVPDEKTGTGTTFVRVRTLGYSPRLPGP